MLHSFKELIEEAKKNRRVTLSVAAAEDIEVLKAVKAAYDQGFIEAILVGNADKIKSMVEEVGLPVNTRIIHEENVQKAAETAVSLIRRGEAQVLLKGLLNSSDYLKAVLNAGSGLRTGRKLSHLSAYEIPGENKLIFFTDGGVNIAPNLEEKKDILINALEALKSMGIGKPKVALLSGNEQVNPKMPSTVDAKAIEDLYAGDKTFQGIVEGPIAMDVALSREAAEHKGLLSRIAGEVDLYLFPNLESSNILSKALIHYAKFKIAGVILGATNPLVMISRGDNAEAKLNSIALACLALGSKNK